MTVTKCWGCGKRTIGCHSTCASYAAFRERMDEKSRISAIRSSGVPAKMSDSTFKSRAKTAAARVNKFNKKET